MKFQIVGALLGLTQGVHINANMKAREVNKMRDLCKNVLDIHPHNFNLLQLDESPLPSAQPQEGSALPSAEPKETTTTNPEAVPAANPEAVPANPEQQEQQSGYKSAVKNDDYTKHYGKSKEQIDAENKEILDTQKKCLNFVKTHQGHPEVCEWCQNEYKKPQVIWKWNPEEEVWYQYYDGDWHYWGPSKDGFTEGGWSYYNGYWHNDGYTFKYENGTWSRFQDKKWEVYGEEVPVNPSPPEGEKKICRPFYKMMKEGFPESLSSTQVPRCKVGDHIYMWTDEDACNFLGGVKSYQERVVCKSGESHKWKRVVKCVTGGVKLESGGFDYKTGGLQQNLYPFKQCEIYKASTTNAKFIYMFGEMSQIPDDGKTANALFTPTYKVITLSTAQMASAKMGRALKSGATLVTAEGGAHFLNNYDMQQFESEDVFAKCQFDKSKVQQMSDADFAKHQIGDIITV